MGKYLDDRSQEQDVWVLLIRTPELGGSRVSCMLHGMDLLAHNDMAHQSHQAKDTLNDVGGAT